MQAHLIIWIYDNGFMKLKVGYIIDGTKALGPGLRFAIWTQGCLRRCYRCTSPELQPLDKGKIIDVVTLSNHICATNGISGITISGGEPLLQAEPLKELLSLVVCRRPSLNVILFTGYNLCDIKNSGECGILDYIDLLIDGKYIDEQNSSEIGLRGSSNQKFHFLTNRLLPYIEEITTGPRKREMRMIGEYEMLTIGIPPRRKSQEMV